MDYGVTFNLGLGGLGIIGRLITAVVIILVLKHFDKDGEKEYNKALKWLLLGGVVCFVLIALFFVAAWGYVFVSPMYYFHEFF